MVLLGPRSATTYPTTTAPPPFAIARWTRLLIDKQAEQLLPLSPLQLFWVVVVML